MVDPIEDENLLAGGSRAWSLILWCMRIIIALQCIGLSGRYLFSAYESESDVFGYLFFDIGWPEKLAQLIDDVGAYGCLVSAIVLIAAGLLPLRWSQPQKPSRIGFAARALEYAALMFVATWAFLLAATHMARGEMFAEYSFGEHAVRFVTPLTMILLLLSSTASSKTLVKAAALILTVAAASTYVVHGYVAQQLHGPFIDLILLSDMRIFKLEIDQSTAETALQVIGWTDIVVGVLLLVTRWRLIAAYMIFWGVITATSRMTAFGFAAWPETLMRAANAGAPLVLLLLYQNLKTKSDGLQT